MGRADFLGPMPFALVLFLVLLVLGGVVLHRSVVRAPGVRDRQQRRGGPVLRHRRGRVKLTLFTMSGFVAGVAGVLFAARLGSVRANIGEGFELDIITMVLLGGVSIFGGSGTLLGVALAIGIVLNLRNGLGLANVEANTQTGVIGVLLIVSVLAQNLLDRLPLRRARGGGMRREARHAPKPHVGGGPRREGEGKMRPHKLIAVIGVPGSSFAAACGDDDDTDGYPRTRRAPRSWRPGRPSPSRPATTCRHPAAQVHGHRGVRPGQRGRPGGGRGARAPRAEFLGPSTCEDPTGQIETMTNAATQGVDAVMISNNAGEQIQSGVDAATDADVSVVSWDSPIPSGEGESLFVAQVDFDETGVVMADMAAEILGEDGGQFAILSASPDAANQNAWIAALEDGAPGREVRQPRAGRHRLRQRRLRRVVQPGPGPHRLAPRPRADHGPHHGRHRRRRQGHDRRGAVRPGQGVRPGPARGDARVHPERVRSAVRLWSFVDLGYLTYYATYGIATGQIEAAEGQTFTAGRMGEYTIEKDPTRDNGLRIVMGPFTVYTEENIDEHDRPPAGRAAVPPARPARPWRPRRTCP